ncbi:MAG: hypothetical protein C4527_01385 [Candidatus Omnitrophota bacterium]|jgi:hypothetical protein|nr:MAG: hypothetical protein C4527_01385 [Candidatus Omnitrophota bacterium]
MSIFKRIFGQNQIDDESIEIQKQHILKYIELREKFTGEKIFIGPDCDVLPNAYGPFGKCLTNPIPVNGIIGKIIYLNRLRSKYGFKFFYHRIGSFESPITSYPVDKYELVSTDAKIWLLLYFCLYFPRRSSLVPEGLTLESWKKMSDVNKFICKLGAGGTEKFLENFPIDLPNAIISNFKSDPEFGEGIAVRIKNIIDKNLGKWHRPTNFFPYDPNEKKLGGIIEDDNGTIYFVK